VPGLQPKGGGRQAAGLQHIVQIGFGDRLISEAVASVAAVECGQEFISHGAIFLWIFAVALISLIAGRLGFSLL
jgi:hypothetical protein